jgi:hypothetical protein
VSWNNLKSLAGVSIRSRHFWRDEIKSGEWQDVRLAVARAVSQLMKIGSQDCPTGLLEHALLAWSTRTKEYRLDCNYNGEPCTPEVARAKGYFHLVSMDELWAYAPLQAVLAECHHIPQVVLDDILEASAISPMVGFPDPCISFVVRLFPEASVRQTSGLPEWITSMTTCLGITPELKAQVRALIPPWGGSENLLDAIRQSESVSATEKLLVQWLRNTTYPSVLELDEITSAIAGAMTPLQASTTMAISSRYLATKKEDHVRQLLPKLIALLADCEPGSAKAMSVLPLITAIVDHFTQISHQSDYDSRSLGRLDRYPSLADLEKLRMVLAPPAEKTRGLTALGVESYACGAHVVASITGAPLDWTAETLALQLHSFERIPFRILSPTLCMIRQCWSNNELRASPAFQSYLNLALNRTSEQWQLDTAHEFRVAHKTYAQLGNILGDLGRPELEPTCLKNVLSVWPSTIRMTGKAHVDKNLTKSSDWDQFNASLTAAIKRVEALGYALD